MYVWVSIVLFLLPLIPPLPLLRRRLCVCACIRLDVLSLSLLPLDVSVYLSIFSARLPSNVPAIDTDRCKADSTLRTPRGVPHPSTNPALCPLTSEVERDPVHSTRCGRQRISWWWCLVQKNRRAPDHNEITAGNIWMSRSAVVLIVTWFHEVLRHAYTCLCMPSCSRGMQCMTVI